MTDAQVAVDSPLPFGGLASYLSGLDELGNTTVQPGALVSYDPLSHTVQRAKYALSAYGFNYMCEQLFEYSAQPTLPSTATSTGYYAFDVRAKQAIVNAHDAGRASWISTEISGGDSIGTVNRRVSPSMPGDSVTEPTWNLAPVTNVEGARAQVAIGFVIRQPLHNIGLLREANSNLFGLGLVWSQPSANLQSAVHDNEFGLEALYTLQVTPTVFVKPDVQAILNAANTTGITWSVVFQLPIVMVW